MFNVAPAHGKLIAEKFNELVDDGIVAARSQEPVRNYLGASLIGYECDRRVGYSYFGAAQTFSGKTYRLFDTGHDAEPRMKTYLRQAGFELVTKTVAGGQIGFSWWKDDAHPEGRFRGHVDGVVLKSPLETIAVPCVWENKAMNAERWRKLKASGLRMAEPEYYVQVTTYTGAIMRPETKPGPALFTAINRDTCEIHAELIEFDIHVFENTITRAWRIINARGPEYLDRITKDPADFRCKFCPHREPCWKAPATSAPTQFTSTPQGQVSPAWVFGR